MVPKGWEFTTFENHIDLLSGFAFKSDQYTENNDDIRLLRGDNIAPNTLRWDGVKTWDKHQYSELQKYHLRENDFVIAMDRTWVSSGLKVAEVTKNDLPCLLVQRVARIRSLPTLEQSLLRQYFSSHRFEQYVKGVQTETAVPHISSKQIKEFPLLLPPLPEQRKIAQILSTWDKAITTTERLIATSQQQKKALMQQLLTGKKRLINPETGRVFEGDWEEVAVSQFGSVVSGGTPSTENPSYWNGNVDWVTPTDITKLSTRTINKTARTITEQGLKNSSAKLVPAGSLLVCTRATIGEIAISQHEMCTNQGFKNLIPNKKTNIDFLYYLMCFEKHKLVSKASGSTFLELSKKDFEHIRFVVPQVNEQQKIASVLTAADKEIELLQAKLAHLKEEKKALMQQLLTGKRRVKIEEMEIA
ncbi:restriction endonuclease subunit S [Vibrio cholerae]|uniref:restriction endonuclease subunit S n=1 Tax=Vibrio cholerae TaxID=666 RepID=UPI00226E7B90|nr:restriction endonuclease subunit S [Vibrio cholerae]EKO3667356.1 restriction endonuclease subunit S [Vibrio metschnikovii]EKF9435247.1 restriction endonuclease subunit S [Vibrio cholerae]MCX9596629.1 restriction endonuclease subunit S [Vibrio cholerae]HBM4683482.1 restriction endonuclease subunit S [Vibrio cholerae]HDG1517102.1 restriction endonuclease subunit S [Vibrio cholerae]